jgi:membrane associated rhomboid family serine protease
MSNPDVENGGHARAPPPATTGIKPPPGRYSADGQHAPVSPFYYDHAAGVQERQHHTWLVPLVVLANVAMFIVVMYYNDCPRNGADCVGHGVLRRFSFQPLKENPLFGPSATTLEKYGGLDRYKVVHGNQAWRLETSTWLHAGLIHLGANMISLIFVGVRLEQQFGFWKVGLVYLLSGVGGSVLSVLFIKNGGVSVGASGALFGLLGAMLSELITNWTIYTNRIAAMANLLIIAAINLAIGILPHVDNFAHIGGFLTGFLLGFVLLIQPRFGWSEHPFGGKTKSKYTACQIVLLVLAVILTIAG